MGYTSFVLKEPNSNKKTSIILLYRYDNKTTKIYTKQTIEPIFWDKTKQRAKQSIKVDFTSINTILNEIESAINELFHKIIENYGRKPDPKELKSLFELEFFENKPQFSKKKHISLMETFDEYGQRMISENKISSMQKYMQMKNNLLEYSKEMGYDIQFETLTNEFRNNFIHFLRNIKKYQEKTIHRKLKAFKTIIFYAIDCKYIKESDLRINLKKFGIPDVESEKIALTQNELNEIAALDLSSNPRLDKVRDRFLIACYTGLRFSDFIRLNKNHIQDDYIIIKQQKTKDNIIQVLREPIRKIFEKYNYELPPPISESNFNAYIKEVCKLCESLQRKQELTIYEGGKQKSIYKPRYELVSSHTGRRTFATLLAEKGISLEDIASATGHKNISTLQGYVKMNQKQKADRLNNLITKIEKNDKS